MVAKEETTLVSLTNIKPSRRKRRSCTYPLSPSQLKLAVMLPPATCKEFWRPDRRSAIRPYLHVPRCRDLHPKYEKCGWSVASFVLRASLCMHILASRKVLACLSQREVSVQQGVPIQLIPRQHIFSRLRRTAGQVIVIGLFKAWLFSNLSMSHPKGVLRLSGQSLGYLSSFGHECPSLLPFPFLPIFLNARRPTPEY